MKSRQIVTYRAPDGEWKREFTAAGLYAIAQHCSPLWAHRLVLLATLKRGRAMRSLLERGQTNVKRPAA